MPQWDFLDFLADNARQYPHFKLLMNAEVTELLTENGKVTGVSANTPDGALRVNAELTIGADGRSSIVREQANLRVQDFGAPIDVFWLRISRRSDEETAVFGRIRAGNVFVMLDRGSYWQCAYVIPKGASESVKSRGLEAFRQAIAELAPNLADRVHELQDWDQVKLLTVKIDRLDKWYRPGLLVIGDAAHAMSPIGGVGINLAIQDAVATANILADALYEHRVGPDDLAAVQKRRMFPTKMTQGLQVILQERVIKRVLGADRQIQLPFVLKLMNRFPILQRIPARLVGLGFRPEHVRSAARNHLG
jgi:2-polyprenyl-6-methoxyphenol hydroxylase-like FAD-dependent oxidoreductase